MWTALAMMVGGAVTVLLGLFDPFRWYRGKRHDAMDELDSWDHTALGFLAALGPGFARAAFALAGTALGAIGRLLLWLG